MFGGSGAAMRASQQGERLRLLAELREAIQRIEHRPARRSGAVGSGLAGVDGVLPDGGFPRGAISELAGGRASGKTAVALALLASLEDGDLFAWVDGHGEIYPPAAAARGVDLARLLIVRPGGGRADPVQAGLWAAEALLGSGAFAAVVMDIPVRGAERGWAAAARRLQAAAEKGGAVGLWLAPPRAALRIPAAVRLDVAEEGGRVTARRRLGEAGEGRSAHHAA
jgi:protein ImuA